MNTFCPTLPKCCRGRVLSVTKARPRPRGLPPCWSNWSNSSTGALLEGTGLVSFGWPIETHPKEGSPIAGHAQIHIGNNQIRGSMQETLSSIKPRGPPLKGMYCCKNLQSGSVFVGMAPSGQRVNPRIQHRNGHTSLTPNIPVHRIAQVSLGILRVS